MRAAPAWCFWLLAAPTIGWGILAITLIAARLLK